MQLIDGRPVYSATDLVGFLACRHLTDLERAALAGLVARPVRLDPHLDLVRKRGFEHEARYLATLEAAGRRVTTVVPDTTDETPEGGREALGERLRRQAAETEAAIRRGDDVIFQAAFFDGTWLGYADFLLRVDEPSDLGPYSYEVTDTKLAHEVRASALLQLCTYGELLARVQGAPPRYVTVALGGGERKVERHRLADYAAFYRALKERFAVAAAGVGMPAAYPPAGTYPEPVEHCAVCRWWAVCSDRRRADDHLSLVAGISSAQRRRLPEHGAGTRRMLAVLDLPPPRIEGTSREAVTRVREQARVQVAGELAGHVLSEIIEPEREEDGAPVRDRGFAALPPPSGGDLFLDFEGDPFAFDDGLEYLVGIVEPGPGLIAAQPTLGLLAPDPAAQPRYHARWALDPAQEKLAFEWLVDLIVERRRRDPRLHVYHYGSYERGRVARLSTRHATREEEVDALLRDGVFIDLYRVVRQGIRASVESYSIKRLEDLYGFHREVELKEADRSIVEFERYLEGGGQDTSILAAIEAYNRDDCVSTWRLRDWLEGRRAEAVARWGELPRAGVNEPAAEEPSEARQTVAALVARLTADLPPDPAALTPEHHARRLLGNLLDWHWREEKSTYWRFFELMAMDDDDLAEQKEPLVGLTPVEDVDETKSAVIRRYAFEPQDNDVQRGDELYDPHCFDDEFWNKVGTVDEINQNEGWLLVRRSKSSPDPDPATVVPRRRFLTTSHQRSLLEIGEWVADHGIHAAGPYRAARDLLLRAAPRLGQDGGGRLPGDEAAFGTGALLAAPGETGQDAALRLAARLDETTLAIQGPPGSGKTTTGAAMILDLVASGKQVGIAALSHKVISNLLEEVMRAAAKAGTPVRAVQRIDSNRSATDGVEIAADSPKTRAALDSGAMVAAGTSWLWTSIQMRDSVDTLFVDEAGQMSLATVVAMAPAARSIVLLGDPQQLEQPLQGTHPDGADASALEHVIGDEQTIAPHRGLFLEHTWRLHPAICAFTSELFYGDRLASQPGLEAQQIEGPSPLVGCGLRWIPARHEGNRNNSAEEVGIVAEAFHRLTDGSHSFAEGRGRVTMTSNDVLIVAPYNAQVAALQRRLPGARVGTVDKFQGQQAPVVIYSMATSSPEDAPRGMEFLYSLNRLNVATSRAKALVVLVCSPTLLQPDVQTPRQLRLANALCRYLELAERVEPDAIGEIPLAGATL